MKYFLLLTILPFSVIFSAPKSEYTPFWDKANDQNTTTISHTPFNQFLNTYLTQSNGINILNYQAVTKEDKVMLKEYIQNLASLPILSYSKKEQQAYWINLYNALTVQVILDDYPVNSIRNIPNRFLNSGPWNLKLLTIEGQPVSLNDIEHKILRPIWKDARIHFLVNCASIGCPNLLPQAITSATYEEVANKASSDFINHPRAVSIKGNRLVLTSLVNWYGVDFGNNIEEIITYFNQYANTATKQKLQQYPTLKISYEYDWDLNEAKNIPR